MDRTSRQYKTENRSHLYDVVTERSPSRPVTPPTGPPSVIPVRLQSLQLWVLFGHFHSESNSGTRPSKCATVIIFRRGTSRRTEVIYAHHSLGQKGVFNKPSRGSCHYSVSIHERRIYPGRGGNDLRLVSDSISTKTFTRRRRFTDTEVRRK